MDLTFVHGTLDPASDPQGYAAVWQRGPSAVAIGKFDGVHRGHRALLTRLKVEARRLGCQAGVVTFDAPPLEVLHRVQAARLTTLSDRRALCAELGLDFLLALRSTPELFATEADEFVEALIAALNARIIVVGADFRFGRAARGNVETLRSVASRFGVEVIGVGLHEQAGRRVSSTRIREVLAAGDVEGAAELLGRPYSLTSRAYSCTAVSLSVHIEDHTAMPAPGVYLARIAFSTPSPGGAVVAKVFDATDGRRRLRLRSLQGELDAATSGRPCTVVFERSAHRTSHAVKAAVSAH